jgi:ATP-binding cassette subfamily B protein RaxB
VLRKVSLTIGAGESVAVTGPSGCGKTTLVKLMLGILPPTKGSILYGGVPLDQIGPREYRTVLAAVMQNCILPHGSVGENIAAFGSQPDMQRVVECARLAQVHDILKALPMGYETLVGSLSGGQLQRVAIAAALYKDTMKVLVMDEATSALDVERERAVNDAIAALGITRIIVAHRPETIAHAGRVVALHSGQVVHDAVIAKAPGGDAAPAST